MSNNTNSWKRVGGFSRTGTQNYVRNNDATMGGTTFGSTDISQNTGNNVMRIGNNSGVIFINGDIDMSGGPGIGVPINRIKHVRDPYDDQDVATKFYVDKTVVAIQNLNQQVGPTGSDGPPGVGYGGQDGSDGPTGPTGPTGLTGPPGNVIGVYGPTGRAGATGGMGPIGTIGATGAVGPAGAQGLQGIQGNQGIQGSNGTILWLNPDGDSTTNQLITDSYMLSTIPINGGMKTVGPITVSATYGNVNKVIPVNRFWNTTAKVSTLAVIPSGVWVVNIYANVSANSDANQLALYAGIFMVTGTGDQPSPDSLIIETKDGGDSGYYPPRAAYLPSHIKYIGKSWTNVDNVLDSSGGAIINSTTRKLYKLEIPVEFMTLKDVSGNSDNVYVQLQIYMKNTKIANQSANAYLYYQTDFSSNETTYSYLQTTFGAVGIPGVPGSVGPAGAQGASGIAGSTGSAGPTGFAGPTGTTGAVGPTGTQGPTGPTGPRAKANSQGAQYALQYRSDVPNGNDISGGDFSGNTNIRYIPGGYTTNASSATTSGGTLVLNDIACNSIHSSFYVEDPSITGSSVKPRTFIRGGEQGSGYVIVGSGIDAISGGTTKTPATVSDITQGVKLLHNINATPATATINLHSASKSASVVGMKFNLTNGNITAAQDQFCIVNSTGRVGMGGITDTELSDIVYSGLNRALHVTGNIMVGTQPGVAPTYTAPAAMIMLNKATTTPTTTAYPGVYHRSIASDTSTTLDLPSGSSGLGITSSDFITFQTGGATQSNSIVINGTGHVSVLGRANLNGPVSVNKNFAAVAAHNGISPNMDISGLIHITSTAGNFIDNPRIKLVSSAISRTADVPLPNSSESANEIRGVIGTADSGFLRLTAQRADKSCIDLIGENTDPTGGKFNNSVRISTGGVNAMLVNGSGNVGIGTMVPGVRLDVSGASSVAAVRIMSTSTTGTALITTGRIGVNNAAPSVELDVTGSVKVSSTLTTVGNVGVATASPTAPLDVTGNAILRNSVRIGSSAAPSVALDVTGSASISGNLNMNSSGRIANLVDPSATQDAATKSYVDTNLSSGSLANNPTILDSGNTNGTFRVLYTQTTSGRGQLYNDYELYYNPSSNTLSMGAASISGNVNMGTASIYGNVNMNSTGRIQNLIDPSSTQDAATKGYVDTKTTDMATNSYVGTAISNALNNGGMTNNPTISRGDNIGGIIYLAGILNRNIPEDGGTVRGSLCMDGNLYYVPNTDTLYATTFNGTATNSAYASTAAYAPTAGSATYAAYASNSQNNATFHIGNANSSESTYLANNGGTSSASRIALVVKPLSNATKNRAYYINTSAMFISNDQGQPVTMVGGYNGQDLPINNGTIFGGKCVGFFEGYIQLDWVIVGSDKRMKQNITEITDGTSSLQLLRKIKCSTFEYVDKIRHSRYKVHGFIAQDIKDIVPESVQLVPDYLPNFYCNCLVEKYSIQENDKTLTFRVYIPVNDVKKLIFTGNHDEKTGVEYKTATGMPASDASGKQNFKVKLIDSSDNDVEVMTTRVIDDFSFLIEVPLNDTGVNDKIKDGMYFIYGQLVDDFHKIDNDHIHNIATAALQEVDRQQQVDKARIAELEAKVAEQQSLINDILERLKKVGA